MQVTIMLMKMCLAIPAEVKVVERIKRLTPHYTVKFCHVCGAHEDTITRYELRAILPENVEVIAGPGRVPNSALKLRGDFQEYDARERHKN